MRSFRNECSVLRRTKVFVKLFAKFFEVFAKFFKVFASFLRFSRAFRGFRIHSDPLGCIRMHSEAIGSVWTFSKNFEIFWMFESFFNVSAHNFYKRLLSRHNKLVQAFHKCSRIPCAHHLHLFVSHCDLSELLG